MLISGDLGAAIAALAPGAPLLGLYAPAPAGAHALRIARDRALLVTPAPLGAADGWRDGWCATAVDDGWAAIDVEGPDAPSALAQGTSADLAAGSPSAAVLFAGFRCLLAADGRGLPAACRGAVAGGAAHLAGRGVTGPSSPNRIELSPSGLCGELIDHEDCQEARERRPQGRSRARGARRRNR